MATESNVSSVAMAFPAQKAFFCGSAKQLCSPYFIMEAWYSLGVMLVKRLKHLEKYWGLSKCSKSEI